MKTLGAINLLLPKSTAQKYMFSTRNIKVIIDNLLTKRLTIRYYLKQDNFDSIKIASERASEKERERERDFESSSLNDKGARNCGSGSKLTAHCFRYKTHTRARVRTHTHTHTAI